ncbi:hypothetical protein EW026_g1525 [Hermanssonia centrifuga]|uniref:PARP-type domain-containing protein n=1 Tax=Hermanssonia centrifuga TaxID=98765 RepID=A0A4S4KR90_9APHY|nr:hypothetical protein EW026_g1525 [Hermanssonia centrifuga]
MATAHMLEYSKSSKATCHGPPPCKGSAIDLGVLRYGQVTFGPYGETVEWRHWGCVTAEILTKLASTQLERVPGFRNLRSEDQNKIRIAVGLRRVDPVDVPESAKRIVAGLNNGASSSTSAAPAPTQKKRKATFDAQPGPSQPRATQGPSASQLVEDDEIEEIVPEEESRDELYVMLKTNIVGVQYYKGLVGPGEEVRLVREPTNKYDKNAIKVENIGRTQVGHIPRQIAVKLSPLMDRNQVTVEGVMHEGNCRGHSLLFSIIL